MSSLRRFDTSGPRHWLATGDAAVPRTARRMLRGASRLLARVRSGSVAAEMDRIVAEATSNRVGSGLAVARREVSRRRRRSEDTGTGIS